MSLSTPTLIGPLTPCARAEVPSSRDRRGRRHRRRARETTFDNSRWRGRQICQSAAPPSCRNRASWLQNRFIRNPEDCLRIPYRQPARRMSEVDFASRSDRAGIARSDQSKIGSVPAARTRARRRSCSSAGRSGPAVVEDVAEMALAAGAMHLGPVMKCERSVFVSTAPSIGAKKLGQPEPDSYLVPDSNRGWPQPAHTKVPARFSWLSGLVPGRSVPCSRSTRYWAGRAGSATRLRSAPRRARPDRRTRPFHTSRAIGSSGD